MKGKIALHISFRAAQNTTVVDTIRHNHLDKE